MGNMLYDGFVKSPQRINKRIAMIKGSFVEASQEFIHELKRAVPEAYFDQMTRLLYSTDASIYQMMPVGVALPRNADEVIAAVEIARKHSVPVLPRGGGSSLAGQAVGHALILDLSRHMDQILEIDPEAYTVRTQPGITLGALNKAVLPYGLMYGPDPASGDRATMGGILANNSTGAHSIVYGMTLDHVLGTKVVLSDGSFVHFTDFGIGEWEKMGSRPGLEGEIYGKTSDILERYKEPIASRYPKTFRHAAGYNLNRLAETEKPNLSSLIVGSEGTLGIVTEMKLNLVRIPTMKRLAMVHFSQMRAAMEATPALLETNPTGVEVIDKMMLDLARDKIEYRRLLTFVRGDPEIILMVEYVGETEKELDAGIQRLQDKLREIRHDGPVVIVADKAGQANVWYVRKVGLGILMSIRGDTKPIPFIEDAAVPVEHLADYVTQIFDYSYSVGLERVAMYGHASAGCLHIRPLVNLKTSEGVRQLRQIAEKSVELVVRYGGTTSGEHAEGIARGEFSEKLFGSELTKAFTEVKEAFDPHGLLNPGKVVGTPRMDDEVLLRFGSDYSLPNEPKQTIFQFINDFGFAAGVEMCNGAGVCRKLGEGVMCPSFQATKDERHSTRARANALRSAMMGLLGPEGITSKEVYEVMDLCLSCHTCKSECPSAVDMAKLKSEFLYQYQRVHGVSLRSWLFGKIASLDKLGQPLAPLSNAFIRWPGKWILASLGVDVRRSLPELTKRTFSAWYRQQGNTGNGSKDKERKQVIFFHDTFTEHNDPHIGQAAVKILEKAGFDPVILADKVCCGRPAVSKGLLEEALKSAKHNVKLLAPYAKQGVPIIGVEPSCMAMLVDEYLDLVPGEEAEAVAANAMTLDMFLVKEAEGGDLNLIFDEIPRQVLFHGHCQQKATFGTGSTLKMLEMIPNCSVEEVDSGCCGMAGSFGYEKEHYDLSIQLAEMSLAPAVRATSKDTIICATGTSCREQILHTTQRRALHPIEVMAAALA
jgi:FAD/FMN-containing dehydrogenase/Fe-S oxidoreductase